MKVRYTRLDCTCIPNLYWLSNYPAPLSVKDLALIRLKSCFLLFKIFESISVAYNVNFVTCIQLCNLRYTFIFYLAL